MNRLAPYVLAIATIAILVLGFMLHKSYQRSSGMEWYIEELENSIGPIEAERDSLRDALELRADSLRADSIRISVLIRNNAQLRSRLRNVVLPEPDFTYEGTDSQLVAEVDSILRSRYQ